MRHLIVLLVLLLQLPLGASANPPFEVSIVPESRSEKSATVHWGDEAQAFYVILTNVSEKSQPVFKTGNSWGDQAISLEITLPDGSVSRVQPKPQGYSVNFPWTSLIPPRSHWVYSITLNKRWESKPDFAKEDGMAITMKAIYSINQTPESKKKGVWDGTIESDKMAIVITKR